MANYLITGGCGFIGSHLADALVSEGHKVKVVDNLVSGRLENVSSLCDVHIADICAPNVIDQLMEGMDGCYHLAAITHDARTHVSWLGAHQVNLIGSIRVFEAARKQKTPVVYASSAAVYGDNADLPLSERSTTRPLSAYGADKLSAEIYARVASMNYGVPTMGLRLFDVFGPRQNASSPYAQEVSALVENILAQESIEILGDGEQRRDFLYVSDAVGFLQSAMRHVSVDAEVFNACRGEALSVNQLATLLMALTNHKVNVHHNHPAREGIRMSIGSPKRAARELRYMAKTTVTRGLRELIDHRLQYCCAHLHQS